MAAANPPKLIAVGGVCATGIFRVATVPALPATGRLTAQGASPILVVGTTGDPATPYAGAQATATRVAGSTLLTVQSTEHTAYASGRSTCIR